MHSSEIILNSKNDEIVLLLNIAHSQDIRFHYPACRTYEIAHASRPVACVICVQENWVSETSDYSLLAIDGYNYIHQSKRAEYGNHGGLIAYVDKIASLKRKEAEDTLTALEFLIA